MGYSIGRGRDAHAPRGCAWAELTGREGLCRRENEEGNILGNAEGARGNAEEARGNKKTRRAVGLAGRDEGKGVFVLEYFRM